MNEKELLLSRARELKERSADNSMIVATNFLSPEERSAVSIIEKENNKYVSTFYYGGFPDAERTAAVFVPVFYELSDIDSFMKDNAEENPFQLIECTKDKFTQMSHRDYLGSLMALGIKREMVGDIVVTENGCHFFAVKSVAGYICENLKRTGRGSVSCSIIDIENLPQSEDNGKTVFSSVASLRLDCVVAAAFSMSRTASSEAINKGVVYVDSVQCFKTDYILTEGSKIVLRGKGKAIIEEVTGQSKKGRMHLLIKKFN